MDEKENDAGEEEKDVEVVLATDDEEEPEVALVTEDNAGGLVADDEDNYAEKEDVEDIESVTGEKDEAIEDDKEDKEKKEEKDDIDDKENGEDEGGRSEETTKDGIDTTEVEAKVETKGSPEKKRCEDAEGNVSDEGETENKGSEASLGGGVVIEQTITVHADGDAVDQILEGRHNGEAEVIDNVNEEVEGGEGVDKGDKGVKEVTREETDVSLSGRREEGSWQQNSTESKNNEEEEEELLDKISLILFSPTSSPITIAVLAALFISSVLGLACIYCRGRRR